MIWLGPTTGRAQPSTPAGSGAWKPGPGRMGLGSAGLQDSDGSHGTARGPPVGGAAAGPYLPDPSSASNSRSLGLRAGAAGAASAGRRASSPSESPFGGPPTPARPPPLPMPLTLPRSEQRKPVRSGTRRASSCCSPGAQQQLFTAINQKQLLWTS
jgi:hypothetical protein